MTDFTDAIAWALQQKENPTEHDLVDLVREYLNVNGVEYDTFSYEDLIPYLPQ